MKASRMQDIDDYPTTDPFQFFCMLKHRYGSVATVENTKGLVQKPSTV